ncbi:MAG TPA: Fic family protein [Alphaproteobacteria bacterium]|nr:Fic family protein [Alphaproteobacteria bacterium]HQS94272.1 Fic family protein [Alphaproteobacteria bacterium]
MEKLLENKTLHSLFIMGVFSVVFLEIHPLQDGNGRLSREKIFNLYLSRLSSQIRSIRPLKWTSIV